MSSPFRSPMRCGSQKNHFLAIPNHPNGVIFCYFPLGLFQLDNVACPQIVPRILANPVIVNEEQINMENHHFTLLLTSSYFPLVYFFAAL